jgi:hypothetical protein
MNDNNFLFNFSNKLNVSSSNVNPTTLPSQDCINGSPVDQYAGTGVYSWEVLFSVWNNYQSTIGTQFTYNQAAINSPTTSYTTGPANIFVIRHGEKSVGSHCLNNNGIYRSCKLIEFTRPILAGFLTYANWKITLIILNDPNVDKDLKIYVVENIVFLTEFAISFWFYGRQSEKRTVKKF